MIRKVLLVLFFFYLILFSVNTVYAAANDNSQITKIEKFIYGYNYSGENDVQRVERLEKYAYGASLNGEIGKRIIKLKKDLNVTDVQTTAQNQPSIDNSTAYDYDEEYVVSDASAQYPIVDALEQKIFNKTSINDDIYSRVSKLEKQIFKKEGATKPLNERVDKLKSAIISDVGVAGYDSNGNVTITPAYSQMYPTYSSGGFTGAAAPMNEENYYSSNNLRSGSMYNELSILERDVLKETFPMLSVNDRLSQLETKVLQRVYTHEDETTRVERLMAAAQAQKNTNSYGGSKWEKNLATGMQVASFLLLILAFVL